MTATSTKNKEVWPFCGYAPGKYFPHCLECGVTFEGDKRAFYCLPCAIQKAQAQYAEQAAEIKSLKEGLKIEAEWHEDEMLLAQSSDLWRHRARIEHISTLLR